MNFEETEALRKQLRQTMDQSISLFNSRHPASWSEYEIVDKLREMGAIVRNGAGISRNVTFPPSEQHKFNAALQARYAADLNERFYAVMNSANELTGREIPRLIMEFSGYAVSYTPTLYSVPKEETNG